ncbi:hypothetical protein CAPTEDRAFT_199562 [Capitella teleta]|uniref:Uncharacterized protein n=1 Tax=Capitella teleta TaxID=283909 RepID=R7UD69_CAPTE|nr:hypothetical protein CAPTEDRAFT_199562 [Capitella teleta]|eukprot:ELU04041.1 hypothetical protein CAPTEDRAFT_199562 [Capitella teleta]
MAITDQADDSMDELSKNTEGMTFLFDPDSKMSYFSAFSKIGKSVEDSCYKEETTTVADKTAKVEYGKPSTEYFVLDATLGRDLLIIFEFQDKDFELKVSSPSGEIFNRRTADEFWCNEPFKTCQFLKALAEMWSHLTLLYFGPRRVATKHDYHNANTKTLY